MNRKSKFTRSVTALYCRLSIEDGRDNESMSISNQEEICQGGISPSETPPTNWNSSHNLISLSNNYINARIHILNEGMILFFFLMICSQKVKHI